MELADGLIDRENERAELLDSVRAGQAVMVYGPRRYGKTSLARAVEREVADEWGILAVHADLWGVSSIAGIVGVLGRSYARVSGVFRVRRFLADLLGSVGFSVNLGQTLSVSYQGSATAEEERAALRALLEVPQRLASRAAGGRVLVVLDEFGEVLNVPGEPDALMRSAFQASPDISFLFMGSKRSLMDGLFTDRRRPFYNFGRRMELGRLPYEPLGGYIEERFEAARRCVTPEAVDVLLDLSQGHPHRAQQLAFHAFRLARAGGEAADEETTLARCVFQGGREPGPRMSPHHCLGYEVPPQRYQLPCRESTELVPRLQSLPSRLSCDSVAGSTSSSCQEILPSNFPVLPQPQSAQGPRRTGPTPSQVAAGMRDGSPRCRSST